MNLVQLQSINEILLRKDTTLLDNFSVDFFSDFSQEYNFIKNHVEKLGNVPDTETFLKNFIDFELIEVNESTEYLSKELIKDKTKRDLATIFNKVRDALNNDNVEEARYIFENSKINVSKKSDLSVVDIFKDTSRYDNFIDKCNSFDTFYVSTGFKELDEIVGGWDRKEELATIVARGGIGKTWALLKSAVASAQKGLRVGIFSGEMSADKVGYRLDTLISNISNFSLTKGNGNIANQYKLYIESLKDKFTAPLYILTPSDRTLGVSDLKAFIEEYNLDILFVDQHSLLKDEHKSNSPFQAAANISKDLKNLQVLTRIPIISACQQNRNDTEETGVSLKNISSSDRIGQDSTIVLFFEQKDKILTMSIVKSRDSVSGQKLHYAIDLDKGIFQYIPANEEESSQQQTVEEETEENVF